MNKAEMNACSDLMHYYGYNGYPTVLHTLNIKKLHNDTCKRKGVVNTLKSSGPYIKAVLWSLFIHSKLDSKDRKHLISAVSASEIEMETGISKRQIVAIMKDATFMDLIEFCGQSYDKSKRYRLLFATWDKNKIDAVLCKEELNVSENTKNSILDVAESPTQMTQSKTHLTQSKTHISHHNDIYTINNTNILTKRYNKIIPFIFNFFEFSQNDLQIYKDSLAERYLENENDATTPLLLPFSGVSRSTDFLNYSDYWWFELSDYDKKTIQEPFEKITERLNHEMDVKNSRTPWLSKQKPSTAITGFFANVSMIANGRFDRFPKDDCLRLMNKFDEFIDKDTKLFDACNAILYYACASSFMGLNMDIHVLIDNIVDIHKTLKEREIIVEPEKAVMYLAEKAESVI